MRRRAIIFVILAFASAACARTKTETDNAAPRIVSLDFCADQYLLAFAEPASIAGLSPDATKSFSYYREAAENFPLIRPRAEDILIRKPDIVIRTYGGGPNITRLLERAGVEVIQVGFAADLDSVREHAVTIAAALGAPEKGDMIAAEMDRRLAALEGREGPPILYMTSKGAVAGRGTMIDEMIARSGRINFQDAAGWGALSLEKLAYERPAAIAAGFFDGADAKTDLWSPSHHPLAQRALANADRIEIPGAWTSCGAWFVVDAIEAMAGGA